MKRQHDMPFGATCLAAGGVCFSIWAPDIEAMTLVLGPTDNTRDWPMVRDDAGWHRCEVPEAVAGDLYRFRLPDGLQVPDPASRSNPDDVHGASEIIDPSTYEWNDTGWNGLPWEQAVIYEMHVGTFSEAGTFDAARERLADLAAMGFTVIEVMPVADFPGLRNWGYDGVLQYAPDAAYGPPDAVKAFVDAAHRLGMAVLLDVVYNHFGPEGNYLHAYCGQFFNAAHQTPWGAAINFDGEDSRTVRDFFVHNALYWTEEFHFDGLRMDAIHAIADESSPDIVSEVCAALRTRFDPARHVHVVLENELNQSRFLPRSAAGMASIGTAQWNDDLHHAAHVLVTGEDDGYYADYADSPVDAFGRSLAEGFVYQGQASAFRGGEGRGEPSRHLPLAAFVSFLQTHDQVGNRAFGDRIHTLAQPTLLHAAYACLLLSPHAPMLFMGEEFAASTPFLFFCDFGPELAGAVSSGRREEFGQFAAFADEAVRARIPDPNEVATFEASKLRWSERESGMHARIRDAIVELLTLRKKHLLPHLNGQKNAGRSWRDGQALRVQWAMGEGASVALHLLAYFGETPVGGIEVPPGELIYATGVDRQERSGALTLSQGAVRISIEGTQRG